MAAQRSDRRTSDINTPLIREFRHAFSRRPRSAVCYCAPNILLKSARRKQATGNGEVFLNKPHNSVGGHREDKLLISS